MALGTKGVYNVQRARLQDSTFCKRHVLADSGIDLIHQRTIAVERFAVLDFHRSLPNARLQSGGLDIVLYVCVGAGRLGAFNRPERGLTPGQAFCTSCSEH